MTIACAIGLVAAEFRGSSAGVWVFKPLASTGFVGAALAAGALESAYGLAILGALVLSWLGDVLLIPRSESLFRAGVLAFLLGHLAFAAAFFVVGVDLRSALAALLVLAPIAAAVLGWLGPHVPAGMRWSVRGYVAVISAMVAAAVGVVGAGGDRRILAGAAAFFVSDLSVARDRFVERAFVNRLWGLPLYYAAQLLFAATVGSG